LNFSSNDKFLVIYQLCQRWLFTFYAPVSKDRGHIVFCLSICVSLCKNFNIGHIYWMASNFDLLTLTLKFDLLFKNF
jgi:hypothetical protein